MGAYSFKDVQASIIGPGGSVDNLSNMGYGAGVSDEGISVTFDGPKGTLQTGADGRGMHTMHAKQSGRVTVRLQQTSPINAVLSAMYHFQSGSSANWGQNTIRVANPAWGDVAVCDECAFEKHPDLVFANEAGIREWSFLSSYIDPKFGDGAPIL